MEAALLSNLNPAQRAAVTSSAEVLQCMAGPGSGKTKTLTTRVAYLIVERGLDPTNVLCVTFTIKAAREMRERLRTLVGEQLESKLILGTFHSVCRRYLAAYGTHIGISKGFGIADSSGSKKIVKNIVKKHGLKMEPNTARNKISWNKARFRTVEVLERETNANSKAQSQNQQEFITIYEEYEKGLKASNLLDYDDLLLKCVELLRVLPTCVNNVEAVLVDEFQDTNIVQYELMKLFASARNFITVVGDVDQSIYGFRSAEVTNLARMRTYYPDAVVINLEENYRSTAAILNLAQAVIDQDTARPVKKLKATHCYGTLPVLRLLPDSKEEASWIASELKRTVALTGGLIKHSDIAVLIRSAYISLRIEKAFARESIPYRMVGGQRFYDRAEIRLIINYLRTIAHPNNSAAFLEILNLPPRGIGDKTVASLTKLSEDGSKSMWQVVKEVLSGRLRLESKLSMPAHQELAKLMKIIDRARDQMEDMQPAQVPHDLIEYVVKCLNLSAYLTTKYPGDEDRAENVKEFIDYASTVIASSPDESLPTIEGITQERIDANQECLTHFLSTVVLTSEVEQDDKDDPKPRVTISTIHSAKGLEWPVVFIPSVYSGSIPHSRAEDVDEERRLLYVAITRSKALTNMSFPLVADADRAAHDMTPFLPDSLNHLLSKKGPSFTDGVVSGLAQVLRVDMPSQTEIARGVASFGINNSLEDNHWPLDGRPPSMAEENVKTVYIPGYSGQSSSNTNCQTTMTSTTSFSTSNTSMSVGFTTAGQQMRSLQTTSQPKAAPANARPQPATDSTRKNITSFFTRQPTASAVASQPPSSRPLFSASARDRPLPRSYSTPMPEPQLPAVPPPQVVRADTVPSPNLTQLLKHRLPSLNAMGRASAPSRTPTNPASQNGIKRPRPLPLEESSPNRSKRAYHFLSSSPTKDLFDENGELTLGTRENFGRSPPKSDRNTEVLVVAERLDHGVGAQQHATLGVDLRKRTLGVRRPFVPWNERKKK